MDNPFNEKFYETLGDELKPYLPMLGKAVEAVVDQEVSNYPILVVSKEEVQIGIKLLEDAGSEKDWQIHISSLEEFSTKNLIRPDRLDSFKEVYKSPKTHLCLFIVQQENATFAFLPRSQ